MDRIATIRTTMLFVVCYLKSVTINVHFRKADLAHKHCYLLFLWRSVISQRRKMRATAALPSCIGWAVNFILRAHPIIVFCCHEDDMSSRIRCAGLASESWNGWKIIKPAARIHEDLAAGFYSSRGMGASPRRERVLSRWKRVLSRWKRSEPALIFCNFLNK